MPFTLFYSPGACSLCCHIALEESGLAYERRRFGTHDGGTESPEYRAINPRDAYLVVFYKWSARPLAQPAIPPMPAFDAVMSRVCARPAVARILELEARER